MKKHVLSAAVAAALAAPAAMAQVELYGSLDVSYNDGSITANGVKTEVKGLNRLVNIGANATGGADLSAVDTRGALTGSRFGVRVKEDLGGGLSATANLEFDVDPAIGTLRNTNARTSVIGLSGGFGSFSIGRQTTGIHGVVTATSPISGSNMAGDAVYSTGVRLHQAHVINSSVATSLVDPVTSGLPASAVRGANMISYTSPSLSGGSVRVDYRKDEGTDASSVMSTSDLGLSFRFAQGPLLVTAGTHTTEGDRATAATSAEFIVNAIAAAYDLKVAKINAIYGENKLNFGTAGTTDYEQEVWQVGVSVPMGPWTFAGHYGEGTRDQGTATNGAKQTYQGYQLMASYALSKRTNIYGAFGTDEIKVTSTVGTPATASAAWGSGNTTGRKDERTQMAIGVRHSF